MDTVSHGILPGPPTFSTDLVQFEVLDKVQCMQHATAHSCDKNGMSICMCIYSYM